ncbi:hypothetical protein [Sulfitobacter dubius]|uniref:hypothetical protein n=1 Tax=Sulfitobacter dubius TaxID=218673 RepID=UPI0022AFF73A|nr:hypothetical protein [Sulfitobacter dubius]MCZ4368831.1 hypothetical protein [Sulfitobacter dubius]
MFDNLPTEVPDEPMSLARCLFFDHGHELAEAAAMLGGASAEAKVVSCALKLPEASKITSAIRPDLVFLHNLLSLDLTGDPECPEAALFNAIDPASREVDMICHLTEMLTDILVANEASNWVRDKSCSALMAAAD